MNLISIDPGKSGGLVLYRKKDQAIEIFRMPVTFSDKLLLFQYFKKAHDLLNIPVIAVIEKIQMMPSDLPGGKVFRIQKMMKGLNELHNAMTAAGIKFIEVIPQSWQRFLNLRKKEVRESADRKQLYKTAAESYLKQYVINGKHNKITGWNADAICIMEYARRRLIVEPEWISDVQNMF